MKKEKYSMKEELKEELRSTTQNVKPEDLNMDETVDDKYTSSVFEKFKNGQTKKRLVYLVRNFVYGFWRALHSKYGNTWHSFCCAE
mgnify:CR=1 FL=1